jgi:mRNA interferase MazF
MMSGMSGEPEPGNLVAIPFPYADENAYKRRPVMILAPPDRHGDIVCLAVTSVPMQINAVAITTEEMVEGQLPKPSWIRCDKVFTLNVNIIAKRYGKLGTQAFHTARDGFCRYIGCQSSQNGQK